MFFTVEQREDARRRLLDRARADDRIVAAAVVGAEAAGRVDPWSDIDLTFGVSEGTLVDRVLGDWTPAITDELDAVELFDVHVGPSVYRVFLFPGCLQVDLSFTPIERFGPYGPDFELLFGTAVEDREREPMTHLAETPRERIGLCVHHLVRARLSLERGRLPQAEHWINSTQELIGDAPPAAPSSRTPSQLRRSLATLVDALLRDSGEGAELAAELEPQLRELAAFPPDAA